MKKLALKFYVFDWDDNVLSLDTKIFMQKNITGRWVDTSVSTDEYNDIVLKIGDTNSPYRFPLTNSGVADMGKAFQNFTDNDEECNLTFLHDCIESINNGKLGPSYHAFKECLLGGHLFMICTARGHNPATIKRVVEHFIAQFTEDELDRFNCSIQRFYRAFKGNNNEDLSTILQWYLNNILYVGVTSSYFTKTFGINLKPNEIALGKAVAVKYFVDKATSIYTKYKPLISGVSIGVSDDSLNNLEMITSALKELDNKYSFNYVVYDTSKQNNEHCYIKRKIVS